MNILLATLLAASAGIANITSERTYYDRKEGVVVFTGKVHVNDEDYQLCSDKAFIYLEGSNTLKRIVAMG